MFLPLFKTFLPLFTHFLHRKGQNSQITCKILWKWCIWYLPFLNQLGTEPKFLNFEDMTWHSITQNHNINSDTNSLKRHTRSEAHWHHCSLCYDSVTSLLLVISHAVPQGTDMNAIILRYSPKRKQICCDGSKRLQKCAYLTKGEKLNAMKNMSLLLYQSHDLDVKQTSKLLNVSSYRLLKKKSSDGKRILARKYRFSWQVVWEFCWTDSQEWNFYRKFELRKSERVV